MLGKIIKTLASALAIILISAFVYIGFGYLDSRFNLIQDRINISGTGSMYPTFPKGEGTDSAKLSTQTVASVPMLRFPGGITLNDFHLFNRHLSRGDIVSFENPITHQITSEKTGQSTGFVKRVIALPGDKIQIRDGFVILNQKPLTESYTPSPRSTFGGQFLPDCRELTIPDGYVFVLGDNRKSSNDSRHDLGLVAISDIDHYLPINNQQIYSQKWRDASKDARYSLRPVLDKQQFINLLNQRRSENGLPQLKYQPKLEQSAALRADVILKYDDMSYEATRSGYTMEKAMTDSGYQNIVWGEAPTLGYYDAQELIENYFEFPSSRKFLLNSDFQEAGISVKVGQLHNCPVQILVAHFAGYKPPNYSQDMLNSWQSGLTNLQQTLPSWEKIKTYPDFYSAHKNDVDELLNLYSTRISRIQSIVDTIKENKWLTDQQEQWTREDSRLAQQMSDLISRLNSN